MINKYLSVSKPNFLNSRCLFDLDEFTAIPVSALKGENVVAGAAGTMPWYSGPTLLETLERGDHPNCAGLRLSFSGPTGITPQ